MTVMSKPHLIVVLGMHRSGTSLVTKSLEILGVDLGASLLPPAADNPKGFFEDSDINRLNIDMLNAIGLDWDSTRFVTKTDVEALFDQGFFDRAAALLHGKLSQGSIFGFKDPRASKLLPFWQKVVLTEKIQTKYIVVIRNPISVAKSLEARNGFDKRKSFLLWYSHQLQILMSIGGIDLTFVDYDNFVNDAHQEIERMSKSLELAFDEVAFHKFSAEFLDVRLRHSMVKLDRDREISNDTPYSKMYEELLFFASYATYDSVKLQGKIDDWAFEFSILQECYEFIDQLLAKISEMETHSENLQRGVVDSRNHISNLNKINEIQVDELEQRKKRVDQLSNNIVDAQVHVRNITSMAESQKEELLECQRYQDSLNEKLNQRDRETEIHIRNLSSIIADQEEVLLERDKSANANTDRLESKIQEMELAGRQVALELEAVLKSCSWKLTKPLRLLRSFLPF